LAKVQWRRPRMNQVLCAKLKATILFCSDTFLPNAIVDWPSLVSKLALCSD